MNHNNLGTLSCHSGILFVTSEMPQIYVGFYLVPANEWHSLWPQNNQNSWFLLYEKCVGVQSWNKEKKLQVEIFIFCTNFNTINLTVSMQLMIFVIFIVIKMFTLQNADLQILSYQFCKILPRSFTTFINIINWYPRTAHSFWATLNPAVTTIILRPSKKLPRG